MGTSNNTILDEIQSYATDSEGTRSQFERVWAENLLMMSGVFSHTDQIVSTVRRRNRTFYRLSWSARAELAAAVHTAYLKDEKTATVLAQNETGFAAYQASVFDCVFDMHIQLLRREQFLQNSHIAAVYNCLDYGFAFGRFITVPGKAAPYNISYKVFPPDQLYLDWGVSIGDARFAIVEHWLSESQYVTLAKTYGFIDPEVVAGGMRSSSILRDIRTGMNGQHGYIVPQDSQKLYCVWECYTWLNIDGQDMACLTYTDQRAQNMLFGPSPLPGNKFPIVVGQTMLLPGIIAGDTIGGVTGAAQAVNNELVNSRLDNIDLAVKPIRIVQRNTGINKFELARAGAGDLIVCDPMPSMAEAITTLETPDVTQGAFMEAKIASDIIRSLAGLPDQTGTSGTPENVISQVYQSAAKKVDFIIGTFAQTYWRKWHEILLDQIITYDDDAVYKLAAASVGATRPTNIDFNNIRVNAAVNTGIVLAHATKQLPSDLDVYVNLVQQATAINQQTVALVDAGLQSRQQSMLFDCAKLLAYSMDMAGIRGVRDFLLPLADVPSPPPPPPATLVGQRQEEIIQTVEGGMVTKEMHKTRVKTPTVQPAEVPRGSQIDPRSQIPEESDPEQVGVYPGQQGPQNPQAPPGAPPGQPQGGPQAAPQRPPQGPPNRPPGRR